MLLDKNKVRLGIAPIAWTNDDLPELGKNNSFEQCISEMALSGYRGTEIGNKYPKDPNILKPFLDIRGLEVCNAWFSTFFAIGEEEKTIEEFKKHRDFLYSMGAKVIGCSEQSYSIQGLKKSIFDEKPIFTNEEWGKVSLGYNKLAQLAEEKGMKVSLHHHMGTGIQTIEEIDIFMSSTNDNVYLLYDTGHIYYSENRQEAVDYIVEKYIKRIVHVHLKDIREDIVKNIRKNKLSFLEGVKLGTFTIPGDGIINFDKVFEILKKSNYEGWIVVEAEQDPALANPFEYAVRARKFIENKTGL